MQNSMVVFISPFLGGKFSPKIQMYFWAGIWFFGYFKYVKFDGNVYFFLFRSCFASFVVKVCSAFWYYLNNLSEVYSQGLKASRFFFVRYLTLVCLRGNFSHFVKVKKLCKSFLNKITSVFNTFFIKQPLIRIPKLNEFHYRS